MSNGLVQEMGSLSLLVDRLTSEQTEATIAELLDRGPTNSLFVLLAMRPELLARLVAQDFVHPADFLRSSMWNEFDGGEAPMKRVESAWRSAVGPESRWARPTVLEGIHACILNGPTSALIDFLNSTEIRSDNSPIASVAVNCLILESPEADLEVASHQPLAGSIAMGDGEYVSSVSDSSGNPSGFYTTKWILENGLPGDRYLDSIGIGNITRFGRERGVDSSVCLLDSGADESHPVIQQKISGYVPIDKHGNYKEAYASIDSGCHGTKVSSIIAGRELPPKEVGLGDSFIQAVHGLRFSNYGLRDDCLLECGIANRARVFLGAILSGAPKKEVGTLNSLMGALDWVGLSSDRNYCCLALSMELVKDISEEVQQKIDCIIELIQTAFGIPVVVAAGNHGSNSRPVSTIATVVANCDRNGILSHNSGISPVAATGTKVMCAQPMLEELNNEMIGLYSGTSFSVGVYAGALAVLCSSDVGRGFDKLTVERALRASARDTGVINLDIAYEELKRLQS